MKAKLIDLKGKPIKDLNLEVDASNDVNSDLISQYVRIYQLNQRQGTVKVKTRSEVRGGGRKPYRQKGTGRARAGTIRSPLWTGGGVVHGPEPRNWNKKFAKKMGKRVFVDAISLKCNDEKLMAFEFVNSQETVSTKIANSFLNDANIKKSVLIVHNKSEVVYKSFRNIQGVRVRNVDELCAYDVLSSDTVLVEAGAFELVNNRVK